MIYAKSNPIETLREHTNNLLKELDVLKGAYGSLIEDTVTDVVLFWSLLDIACEFHDLGKVITPFQNTIKKNIGLAIDVCDLNEVGHNYISPAFINFKKLGIPNEYKDILVQTIIYHHERNINLLFDDVYTQDIKRIVTEDLCNKTDILNNEFQSRYYIKQKGYNVNYLERAKNRIKENDAHYKEYVLLKGLLHRLDYSASAGVPVELDVDANVGVTTEDFMFSNGFTLNDVQKFAVANRDKSAIVIASTGAGKTETALLWLSGDKGFFTLPLRVSINAIYDRVCKGIGFDAAGLLHSTSLSYLEENGYSDSDEIINESKLLSKKLTFCTIDQILKFPFKYKGYERELATLSYSKVVIDEIQAYSPEICAVLLKGLQMIHEVGGKFLLMTATLPSIYLDELKSRGVVDANTPICHYNSSVLRHKVRLNSRNLKDDLSKIMKDGESKKVLVIVNTIKEALTVYRRLGGRSAVNLGLLHSLYINKDRSALESQIKHFDKTATSGIWITTQIVEASLDIDFDVLYTEISSLDSLLQRLGRCNRKGKKKVTKVNVEVYTEEASGIGTVYDKDVIRLGIKLLEDIPDINKGVFLDEALKVGLVEKLYSKESLRGTEFYRKFKKALKDLDTSEPYELTKHKAQRILRDIDSDICIPRSVYNEIENTLIFNMINIAKAIEGAKDKDVIAKLKGERTKIKNEIIKHTISLPKYRTEDYVLTPVDVKSLKDINIIDCEYDISRTAQGVSGEGVCVIEV